MSANGSDRHRMTGLPSTTADNLAWLAEAAVSQSPSSTARPSEGMLSGSRSSQTQGHDSHAMLSAGSSTMANMGAILRPSVSASSDPAQRLLASGAQYPGGQPPYSSLYSTHGQPSHLASLTPYGSFYHPYSPSSYSPSSHFPHIESYSAVLASMGSHVQHGQQGQVTRGGHFLSPGPMSQYSALSHRSHSAASSPGPSAAHQRGSPHLGDSHLPDQKSPKTEPRENDSRAHALRQGSTGSFREDKPQLSPLSGSGSITKGSVGHSRESPKSELFAGYKVPSGKEGSLKHRILTRPHEEGPGEGGAKMVGHGEGQEDVVPSKRPKLSSSSKALGNHGQVPLFAPVSSASPMSSGHHPLMAGPGPPPAHSTSASYSSTSSPPVPGPSPEAYYGHPSTSEPATSSSSGPPSSELFYPPHFMKGSIIQLANGTLKRVEDLQTDDFVHSAQISTDLKVDSSRVVSIQKNLERSTAILGFSVGEAQVQVTVEATLEHPFFVFERGWSSCSPDRTQQRYGLECHPLNVGDLCISLTHKDVSLHSAELSQQQQQPSHPASGTPHQTSHSVGERGQGEGSSERRGLVHAHSSELQPSGPGYEDSSGSLRPPRKRRWSTPEVDSSEEEGHVPPHPHQSQQQQQQGGKEREQTVTSSSGSSLAPTTTGASSSLADTLPSS